MGISTLERALPPADPVGVRPPPVVGRAEEEDSHDSAPDVDPPEPSHFDDSEQLDDPSELDAEDLEDDDGWADDEEDGY